MTSPLDERPTFWHRWDGWCVIVATVVFAAGNGAFLPLLYQRSDLVQMIVFPWFGVLGAQIGLLSAWCVFAPVNGWLRVRGTLGLSFLVFGPLVLCDALARPNGNPLNLPVAIFLLLVITVFTAQAPLWVLKVSCGWRVSKDSRLPTEPRGQYSIQNLLGLMTIIGILIVAMQKVFGWLGDGKNVSLLLGIAAISLLPSLAVLLSVVPALYAILRVRQPLWITWLAYCTAAMLILGLATFLLEGRFDDAGEIVTAVSGLPIGLTLTVALVRREGFRLMTGWDVESKVLSTE
jgi:hypothetical protein